jgi:hypothetical protein
LIDLYGKSLNEVFAGFTAVQIHFQNERIIIAASEIDQRIQSREARLTQAIASGLKLKVASMYHGAGNLRQCASRWPSGRRDGK